MRVFALAIFLSIAVLFPKVGNAQVYWLPTPAPQVTAAHEWWQFQDQPVFFLGDFYYPSVPTVYFDGNVMVRSGMYRGIPLYVDATLEPNSVVYVPIGGNVMRPYERKRYSDIAGTVGSRTPWYPIQRDVELSASGGAVGIQTPALANIEQPVIPESFQRQPGGQSFPTTFNATGTLTLEPATGAPSPAPRVPERAVPNHIQSIPPPQSNAGIWIEYNGARWYGAGAAVPYSADRFLQIGDDRGFPVYREKNGPSNEIWVAAVIDGPLAPFRR